MPPKRASKRQASKSSTQAVSAKQRRSEGKSASLPNSTTSSPQFSPTALSELISNAISGALQSAGIGTLNISPAVGEQRPSNQSTSQPTVVEDAASTEIADLTNTVAAGRLTFASRFPVSLLTSSLAFRIVSRQRYGQTNMLISGLSSPYHQTSPTIDYLSQMTMITLVFALSTLSQNGVAYPLTNGLLHLMCL